VLNFADLGLSAFALTDRPRAGVRLRLGLPEGQDLARVS
jgi:hypothetical protein